ncbi:hypothetical protein [Halopiger goleimassiliensis]|uniref:hypothetical protein n=1 Tax=Halopiger goleimassiliensis TaxID=1293048 RepID=UPI0006780437|nr:hypothetical protein [Halopiger goleimassiliensis]
MSYGRPIAAAVSGGILASVGYALFPDWTELEWQGLVLATITVGLVIVIGLSLCLYGLFTGIETAVAAGTERTPDDGSAD